MPQFNLDFKLKSGIDFKLKAVIIYKLRHILTFRRNLLGAYKTFVFCSPIFLTMFPCVLEKMVKEAVRMSRKKAWGLFLTPMQ